MGKKNIIKETDARLKMEHFLSLHFDMESNVLRSLTSAFTIKKYKKKELIISEDQNIDKVCFIVEGLVRVHYTKQEKEITTWFLSDNDFFMPVYHILTGKPNYNNYEALEQTIVLEASYKEMEKIYSTHPKLEHLGRKVIELYYATFLNHSHNVLFLSAEERYATFMAKRSELLNRVALKYIASYLGVSQETLSRIRAKQL